MRVLKEKSCLNERDSNRHSDLLIIEPKVFGDDRGFFFESFNRAGLPN